MQYKLDWPWLWQHCSSQGPSFKRLGAGPPSLHLSWVADGFGELYEVESTFPQVVIRDSILSIRDPSQEVIMFSSASYGSGLLPCIQDSRMNQDPPLPYVSTKRIFMNSKHMEKHTTIFIEKHYRCRLFAFYFSVPYHYFMLQYHMCI